MTQNINTATVNASAATESAFVDVRNHGLINKQTTVSMAGHDLVTMPRKAAAAAGTGLMTGVGMAVASVGCAAALAGVKFGIGFTAGVISGVAEKGKTGLAHFGDSRKKGKTKRYDEDGNEKDA